MLRAVRDDWAANKGNYKGLVIVTLFRAANKVSKLNGISQIVLYPIVVLYKGLTEFIFGIEIHWRAQIGGGLIVYHGYSTVINSNVKIGRNVVLRHCTTIGVRTTGDRDGPTIGNNVDIGAGAIILGPVQIGDDTTIGAGSVVLTDVPKGCLAVGNPARIIHRVMAREGAALG